MLRRSPTTILLSVFAVSLMLAGCVTNDADAPVTSVRSSGQQARDDSTVVPKNYRPMLAQWVRDRYKKDPKILQVLVTKPDEQWLGLISGGYRPAVCMEVRRESAWSSHLSDFWLFSFQNNAVDDERQLNHGMFCKEFLPLKEFTKKAERAYINSSSIA